MTKSIGGASKKFLSLTWCLISKSSAPGVTGRCRMDMYKVTPRFSRGVWVGVWPYPKGTVGASQHHCLLGYDLWAVMTTSSANERGPDKNGNSVSVTFLIL